MSPLAETPANFYTKQKMFFDKCLFSITFTFLGHESCSLKAARWTKMEISLRRQPF